MFSDELLHNRYHQINLPYINMFSMDAENLMDASVISSEMSMLKNTNKKVSLNIYYSYNVHMLSEMHYGYKVGENMT